MQAKGKKKFKRQDFVFQNSWFETLVKSPRSIHMQQFQISDCEESEILILDASAGVFVDDCKFCTLFIGPSQSSIFIRNCHYLNVICLTQQFRVRDSTNCRFWLWCESQPVIESSHYLTFSCFPFSIGYGLLLDQMKQAGLNLWNNNWFDIYDFTPTKCNMENHKCIETKANEQKLFEKVRNKIEENGMQIVKNLTPLCLGTHFIHQNGNNSYAVVIISPVPERGFGLPILHSRISKLPQELKSFISQPHPSSNCLFVKVKSSQLDQWKRIPESQAKIVGIVSQQKEKEILERTVFIPFGDQR